MTESERTPRIRAALAALGAASVAYAAAIKCSGYGELATEAGKRVDEAIEELRKAREEEEKHV